MKRCIIIVALCSIVLISKAEFQPIYAEPQEVFGRSFMYMRPAYEHVAMSEQLWHNIAYPVDGKTNSSIQTALFIQKSIGKNPNTNRFARYFLINDKNKLLMAGDDTPSNIFYKRDLRAEWFNLPADFSGQLTMNPSQLQTGFLIEFNQDLCKLFNSSFFENCYLSAILPFVHVENNLHLQQSNIHNPGTGNPRDILQAFNQPAWHYDRIDGQQTTDHFAELRVCMYRVFMDEDNYQFAYYTGVVIPTAPKPNPEFLFNAYAGNGQHFGLNGGVDMQISLSDCSEPCLWSLFLNLDATFLVKNKQHRTVDLKRRPWSRFLLFNTENDPIESNIPGVNVLTIKTLIRSYGIFDFSTGFRYQTDWLECEVGYNVWGHDQERVEFIEPFITNKGIAYPLLNDQGLPQSASTSTISTLGDPDPIFVTLKESDLDLRSAATGSALNQKFHVAGGMHHEGRISTFMGAGAFVDWAHKNSPLSSWGGWLKFGCSF